MGRAQTSSGEWTLWVVALSCALHAAEEFFTGWQRWAGETLGILMPTTVFLGMNAVLVIAALLLAPIGWQRPALTLVIPVATVVNAICFHILPTILTGHVSPGLYTATVLYVPFSSWAVVAAARHGAPRTALLTALLVGATMATGVVIAARWLGGADDATIGGYRPLIRSPALSDFAFGSDSRTIYFITPDNKAKRPSRFVPS